MNKNAEKLIELTKNVDPLLSIKTKKLENESPKSFLHISKERNIEDKYYKLLLSLLDPVYSSALSDVIKKIRKNQYDIMYNTGWSIGSREGCFLESTIIGQDILYHIYRDENGYCLDPNSSEYTKFIEESFLEKHADELAIMHQLFSSRDNLISQVLSFVTNPEDSELVIAIMQYINICLNVDELVQIPENNDVKTLSRSK